MRRTLALFAVALVALAVAALKKGDTHSDSGRKVSPIRHVPVNAVLLLDRSASMTGPKMDRAREAVRTLVQALGPADTFALVEFGSGASVLIHSAPVDAATRARALAAIDALEPAGGTNLSAAFALAAGELRRGAGPGRADEVFLASDGKATAGECDRDALLRLARDDFGGARLSTFGIGDDFDEDLMAALAVQGGGRARSLAAPELLPQALVDELARAGR